MSATQPSIEPAVPLTACRDFTEQTLTTPGWYFVYPTKQPGDYGRPKFMEVTQESIEEGWLKCKAYAGTYLGPIEPPPRPSA